MALIPLPLTDRQARSFVSRIVVNERGCWIWTGSKTTGNKRGGDLGGYGKVTIADRTYLAHRVMFQAVRGPITYTLDHLCRDRACIRPRCHEDVTMRVNVLRGNGIASQNARKTHCKRGHSLTGSNLVLVPGGRMCRACRNESYKAYRQRKRATR